MSFNLQKMIESKRDLRRELAARPLVEKLRMLDALRERALALRPAKPVPGPGVLREEPPLYGKSDDAAPVRP